MLCSQRQARDTGILAWRREWRGVDGTATVSEPAMRDEGVATATQARPRLPALAKRLAGQQGAQVALAAALVALCVWFHVCRLAQTPGWDPQEGYNLDLAWNLLHGRLRLFALTQDFAQHPPLFYLQLALGIRLFGYNCSPCERWRAVCRADLRRAAADRRRTAGRRRSALGRGGVYRRAGHARQYALGL